MAEKEQQFYRYKNATTDLHEIRDYRGRKYSVEEIADLCGVTAQKIYKDLENPDSPKDSIQKFIRWRYEHLFKSSDETVGEIEKQRKVADLRKAEAEANIKEREDKISEEIEQERKNTELQKLDLTKQSAKFDLDRKQKEYQILNKEYINKAEAQRELNEALTLFSITLANLPNNFSERWASMNSSDDIRDEMKIEIERMLNSLSEIDISLTAKEAVA